ncbi:Retrovirus-related Pol polyprotein from transposon 412 family [Cucumis melo var. makuwa]|uniref:Retrovirus-related Pol polyprotein from transposon 412 family n=1 Tax=Cucumis melo var. makuwa TaxID=1194695 RepID=A0A5D3DS86_CUCMM|nr:Retrovirus-related Pol polyprotein from transposon 412 family [Cucumis melo var. makuwa]TYK26322.1 Retrovirus-related Pol polyprotein from transposon 412 family [Cucumis melo var. makuwa]
MTRFELGEVSLHGLGRNCAWAQNLPHGLEVDPAKIDVIHSRIFPDSKPLSNLLCTDQPYDFDQKCNYTFQTIKDALTSMLILITPDWSQPFELMCDASDMVLGLYLVKRRTK